VKEMVEKCKNCGYKISKDWHYCPRCGFCIDRWYDKINFGLDEIINHIIRDIQNVLFKNVLKIDIKPLNIEVSSQSPSTPLHKGAYTSKMKKENKEPSKFIRNVKEIVEPEANIIKGEDFTEVEMDVKGVKSIDDVFIVLYDNSAEIRAYTENNEKMYFKIVEIPPYADVADKVLKKDGKLILRFEIMDYYDEDSH